MAVGHGLREFLLLLGVTMAAVLSLGRIRSRSKLIYVGLFAGSVAALLVHRHEHDRRPAARPRRCCKSALRNGLWAVAAGFIMTGLLPFIENLFGVLTDLSLLELGDVAHPLLQELVRRAPSTYNHSVTVGSIAEAAAEASTPAACWSAWGPISTTSARCSSRAISSRTRAPTTTATRRWCPP